MAVVDGRALPIQEIYQAAMVVRRDVDKTPAGVSACGMGQLDCAVNLAFGFELTLDFDPVSGQEREIGRNLEALRGEIYERAETGGTVAMQKAPPVDGDAKVLAWIGHGRPLFDRLVI